MNRKAFLVNYALCDGCRLCEQACCRTHGYTAEQSGIRLSRVGPYRFPSGREELWTVPTPTDFCDRCGGADKAVCAAVCPKGCLELGEPEKLSGKLTGKKMALFVRRDQAVPGEELK